MKRVLFLFAILMFLLSCKQQSNVTTVHLWHQMEPPKRPVLNALIKEFEAQNPDIKVVTLAKGTEEVRTGFQAAAAFTGGGPELVYGPMDQIGPFEAMKQKNSDNSIIMPLENIFPKEYFEKFNSMAVVRYKGHIYQIGDRLGNHLSMAYNMKLFKEAGLPGPPQTVSQLIEYGKKMTIDKDGDGKPDQYGLVWNYTEPFWYIPFYGGYGGKVFDANNHPIINNPAAIKTYQLILDLKNKYKIMPSECDYDIADNMFNQGRAAMIINGDWSWQKYIDSPDVQFGLAKIPMIDETHKWSAPFVSSTGYSINASVKGKKLEATKRVLEFLLSEEAQRRFTKEHKSIPSLISLQNDPAIKNDPILKISAEQIAVGDPMPIIPEMRAVWDAMRPSLQSVIAGTMTPQKAAEAQQKLAEQKISSMFDTGSENAKSGGIIIRILYILGILAILWITYILIFRFILVLMKNPNSKQTREARFAVWLAVPATIVMFGVVIYPFIYNIIISFSNMSMTTVNSWQVIGFEQYVKVFGEKIFYTIFSKTVIWTVVNVFFHVVIGVFLALLLNRALPGKSIFRVLLILPWAVPQYITALTWRGMFNSDTGQINQILTALHLHTVNWLSEPTSAFIACIITNIWLGFPFMMIIALGGLQSIPDELYEAAEMDGASRWKQFWNVTVPLLKPVMIPAITLGIVWTFNNLNVMWLVTNGGEPADHSHILVSYVYRAAFNLYEYGYAAAFSVIIFIILAVFSISFMNRTQATENVR
ncbi:MAG TPA: extracellular solute-binding protein [Candidatus Cloacimonadota bacterium]|nr:extracellular solute-binding protein [Candidatus Cloacimonadota bacterium]HPT72369.1 extracellular solute-binding protein [Candidatus Cloacimonadota bacterium]